MEVRYAIGSSRLGLLLVAGTVRGIGAVEFGRSVGALEGALGRAFPEAVTRRDDDGLGPVVELLRRYLDGEESRLDLEVDAAGTPLEERVWGAVRAIPVGATRSYGAIARKVGGGATAQEVAAACAANPVALIVPCHRVVRSDGTPGGYRWGAWRKRWLLAREAREIGAAAA